VGGYHFSVRVAPKSDEGGSMLDQLWAFAPFVIRSDFVIRHCPADPDESGRFPIFPKTDHAVPPLTTTTFPIVRMLDPKPNETE